MIGLKTGLFSSETIKKNSILIMFRKALAFGSLAILGQSLSIQTSIHYDQCIVEDMAENGFSDLVDWTNEHDNNMEII